MGIIDRMEKQRKIVLSRRQVKEADRVGGIELMLPWPDHLPHPRKMAVGEWVEATSKERQWAEDCVRDACKENGLVPVHVRAHLIEVPELREIRHALGVTIIGQRWVHASVWKQPRLMWAAEWS